MGRAGAGAGRGACCLKGWAGSAAITLPARLSLSPAPRVRQPVPLLLTDQVTRPASPPAPAPDAVVQRRHVRRAGPPERALPQHARAVCHLLRCQPAGGPGGHGWEDGGLRDDARGLGQVAGGGRGGGGGACGRCAPGGCRVERHHAGLPCPSQCCAAASASPATPSACAAAQCLRDSVMCLLVQMTRARPPSAAPSV